MSRSMFRAPTTSDSSESEGSAIPTQTPTIDTIVASIDATVSLAGTLPLNPPDMSTSATTVIPNPPTNGIKGITPAIFDGKRNCAKNFLNEFCQFKLLNRKNKSFSILFYHVLTALSYICGPLVKDWVNAQDKHLEKLVDPSGATPIAKMDEVLWTCRGTILIPTMPLSPA